MARSPVFSEAWHRTAVLLGVLLVGSVAAACPARAQAPLRYVNERTTVQALSFRFADSQTFTTDRLREQIATDAPGFWGRLRNTLSFLPGLSERQVLFSPITLQKDVVRLRQFYRQNGFPTPDIDYPASQLDSTRNRIHVIFRVREGPSLNIRDTAFLNADGTAPFASTLAPAVQDDWMRYRRSTLQAQGRYTEFKRTQLAEQVQSWLRNRGFAFAQVQSSAAVDTAQYAADLRFLVDAGPKGVVSAVDVEGNAAVDRSVILRELPFAVGDRFSAAAITEGQRKLFDLNLFRVALADVPTQPRDSTVRVRYRVRETNLRALSGQIGYDTQSGATAEGSWRHRNFYGDARTFIASVTAETGLPENPPAFLPGVLTRSSSQELRRTFRASVTLRQPYLFSEDLSGSLSPFAQERLNPAFAPNPDRLLDLNERQYGLNSSLVYDLLPYRTLSLRHSFSRTRQYLGTASTTPASPDTSLQTGDDLFNKSVFTLNGTFGDADDFINPSRGYIFRPTVQVGGYFFESGVEFVELGAELSGYLPLSDYVELAGRVFVGALRPFDESRDNLTLPPNPSDAALQRNRVYQNRFSDYLLYAGGGSDVRGWSSRLAGGKVLRESPLIDDGFVYRPLGARTKIGGSLEARFPLPGLGPSWRTAAFFDAAWLSPGELDLTPPPGVSGVVAGPDGAPVGTEASQLLVGTGAGLRYRTPFGFLRIDLAYKLTPDALDLRSAGDVGRAVTNDAPRPLSEVNTRTLRRFRLHFGIGRSF
jgi:outer membrane protein insertion porin family